MQTGEDQKMKLRALILAAGMGTRMKQLSVHTPKALVEVAGKPLLRRVIDHLSQSGVKDIRVNLHHHAPQVQTYLQSVDEDDLHLSTSDETETLLDTGGGIQKASPFLGRAPHFLSYNVDILTDLDLQAMYQQHIRSDKLVTLAVRERPSGRYFRFDEQGMLAEWMNVNTGESMSVKNRHPQGSQLAFSGIMMARKELLELMLPGRYSLTPFLLALAANHPIGYFRHDQGYWLTVGNPNQKEEAEEFFRERGE